MIWYSTDSLSAPKVRTLKSFFTGTEFLNSGIQGVIQSIWRCSYRDRTLTESTQKVTRKQKKALCFVHKYGDIEFRQSCADFVRCISCDTAIGGIIRSEKEANTLKLCADHLLSVHECEQLSGSE